MGSAGDFLFGSSQDGRQTGSAKLLTGNQGDLLGQLVGVLQGQIGQGVDSYQGTYTPGTSSLQQQGFDLVNQILSGQGAYGGAQDALSSMLEPYNSASAVDYWQDSVQAPMMQQWEDDILPRVQETFISQNAGSSGAANRAIAKSGADLATDMNASLADILFQDRQAHTANSLQAAGRTMDMGSLLTSLGLNAGGVQRDIAGEQLMEDYNDWEYSQAQNNPWLQQLGIGLGTRAFEPIVQGPTRTPGSLDSISNFLKILL